MGTGELLLEGARRVLDPLFEVASGALLAALALLAFAAAVRLRDVSRLMAMLVFSAAAAAAAAAWAEV